jgi:hypothetical protein
MMSPSEIINRRYGSVFLSKGRNLKIVSREKGNQEGDLFSEYNALLSTGTLNPTVISVLVQGQGPEGGALLQDLPWNQVHVRSYASWDDVVSAGITLRDTEPQKPLSMAGQQVKDIPMRAVSESENSKTYHFNQEDLGRITLFTSKPTIATGGNDLPRSATLLPWLADANFVFELGR